ncbi:MAG TPA: hypothetical protein VH986_10970 [Acidimicrobiia bacterium]|jgi:hypothetical protein
MSGTTVADPRAEAVAAVGGRFDARVLEPSPPAVNDPQFFADDPAAPSPRTDDRPLLLPVPGGDVTWDDLARTERALTTFCADRWLGAWRPLAPIADADAFTRTRASLHAVAEHVVATARRRANGKIGLRFTTGGFGTPFFGRDGANVQVRVAHGELVVVRDRDVRREPVTTLRAAGLLAGVTPAAAPDLYEPATAVGVDEPLAFDGEAARLIGDWYGFACSVLEELRAEQGAWRTRTQLWPEHFDLSIDLGDEQAANQGTFGASPGDAEHPLPYLYVTHWAPVADDPFWDDEAFGGASLSYAALAGRADGRSTALAFFRAGVAALHR